MSKEELSTDFIMKLIHNKKIRKHILKDNSAAFTAEKEYKEYLIFRDFLHTRNGMIVGNIRGKII